MFLGLLGVRMPQQPLEHKGFSNDTTSLIPSVFIPEKDAEGNSLYKGTVYHIFFHSLVIYPERAFTGTGRSKLYEDYMITRDQFDTILSELYKNNFILIDIHSLYSVRKDGTVVRKHMYVPKGKKPLIISIDDLSYYRTQHGDGFANKLVLDVDGRVATEVTTPAGETYITRDGDIVPILDDFVETHPDFSLHGVRGVIALTGYDGVFGYRTQMSLLPVYAHEAYLAGRIARTLKNTGWGFASHSYSHAPEFRNGTITIQNLQKDVALWDKEVKPIVGETDIYIGPFGQVFSPGDERRQYLVSHGFTILGGVGVDLYLQYFKNYVVMDRADIDGYRLRNTPEDLKIYFDPNMVMKAQ